MGSDLRRDRKAVGLGPADHLDGAGGAQVEEVHRGAGEPHEGEIACQHHLLGERGLSRDSEPARPGALVHVPARGEVLVLAVLGQDDAEADAYSSARRIKPASCTPRPSSVNSRTPSAGQLRHRNEVLAPPADRDRAARRRSVRSAVSPRCEHVAHDGGGVDRRLGVRHRDARLCSRRAPPALEPDSTVSATSPPGSRRCAWRSTRPGATTQPSASSTTAAPLGTSIAPDGSDPAVPMSTSARRGPVSSTTVPPRTRTAPHRPLGVPAGPCTSTPIRGGEQDRHADERRRFGPGDVTSVARQVRHVGCDLHTPVHRTGVHHDRVLLRAGPGRG